MWTQSMTNPSVGPPACVPLKTLSGEWSHQVNTHGPLHHSHSCVLSSPSDFGFERVNLNSPCTPLPYLSWPPPPPTNCPEQANYSYTSGSAPFSLPSPPPTSFPHCMCHVWLSLSERSLPLNYSPFSSSLPPLPPSPSLTPLPPLLLSLTLTHSPPSSPSLPHPHSQLSQGGRGPLCPW